MSVRQIEFESDDYRAECALRQAVLRAPLGLDLCREDLGREREQWHFGLFDDNGGMVACVVAVPESPDHAKLRQMAVADGCRGRGHGRRLMQEVEGALAARGITRLSMHARTTAAGFYQNLGWAATGAEFTEVGIPHLRMEKRM